VTWHRLPTTGPGRDIGGARASEVSARRAEDRVAGRGHRETGREPLPATTGPGRDTGRAGP